MKRKSTPPVRKPGPKAKGKVEDLPHWGGQFFKVPPEHDWIDVIDLSEKVWGHHRLMPREVLERIIAEDDIEALKKMREALDVAISAVRTLRAHKVLTRQYKRPPSWTAEWLKGAHLVHDTLYLGKDVQEIAGDDEEGYYCVNLPYPLNLHPHSSVRMARRTIRKYWRRIRATGTRGTGYYTTWGEESGGCEHCHRDPKVAKECIRKTGHDDREVFEVRSGRMLPPGEEWKP